MTLLDSLSLLFTAVLTVVFVRNLRHLGKDYAALRTLKRWKWAPALLGSWSVLAVVLATGLALTQLSPQVLGWSWVRLLAVPGESAEGRNFMASGLRVPYFSLLFLALMAVNVPTLAMNEELAFRKGHKSAGKIVVQSVKFGLAHCLVGVPVGIGLALSLAGGWFAWQYLRGGVRRSASYHSLHNWTLLGLAAAWLAFGPR